MEALRLLADSRESGEYSVIRERLAAEVDALMLVHSQTHYTNAVANDAVLCLAREKNLSDSAAKLVSKMLEILVDLSYEERVVIQTFLMI